MCQSKLKMRNSAGNFWQMPCKPTKSTSKSCVKTKIRTPTIKRITSSTQTDRVVLIKEENLNFCSHNRFVQNDSGMRRDYLKAVNYINSCHKFINAIIDKNNDRNNSFFLPMTTNFIPIFSHLLSKKGGKPHEKKLSENLKSNTAKFQSEDEEKKSRSSLAVNTPLHKKKVNVDLVPIGDCTGELRSFHKGNCNQQVTNVIQNHLTQVFASIQNIIESAAKRSKTDPANQVCKNLDMIKDHLWNELSKMVCVHKDLETPLHRAMVASLKDKNKGVEIFTEIEYEDAKNKPLQTASSSISSLVSDSSYIKSDSDCEIKILE